MSDGDNAADALFVVGQPAAIRFRSQQAFWRRVGIAGGNAVILTACLFPCQLLVCQA